MEVNGIFQLKDKQVWEAAFEKLPPGQKDIYYTPGYYSVYESSLPSDACCYIFKEKDNIFFYPFLKTKVKEEYCVDGNDYYDLEGAYGYNGPLANTNDMDFLGKASDNFINHCKKENVIAEFTRYNPVLKNENLLAHIIPLKVNENIVLDLSIENILMDAFEHSTRKNINKAERNGLTVYCVSGKNISSAEMDSFVSIYHETMKRNNADESYYFSRNYFEQLAALENEAAIFFFTKHEDKVVSCELVMCGAEIGYSFLGGTLSDYFAMRANDILKYHIITTLKNKGLNYFCLGGGVSPGDGIFNYKKCFAKNGVKDFFIGKKIHNEKIYNAVVKNWELKFPEKKEAYKNHLLKYKN